MKRCMFLQDQFLRSNSESISSFARKTPADLAGIGWHRSHFSYRKLACHLGNRHLGVT